MSHFEHCASIHNGIVCYLPLGPGDSWVIQSGNVVSYVQTFAMIQKANPKGEIPF